MNDQFGFGEAIKEMHHGNRVQRAGWNGKGMYLFLVADWQPTNAAGNPGLPTLPFIAMKTADNKVVPWLASQTDMLAADWAVVG